MRQYFPLKVIFDLLFQRHVFGVAQFWIGLRFSARVGAYLRALVALAEGIAQKTAQRFRDVLIAGKRMLEPFIECVAAFQNAGPRFVAELCDDVFACLSGQLVHL